MTRGLYLLSENPNWDTTLPGVDRGAAHRVTLLSATRWRPHRRNRPKGSAVYCVKVNGEYRAVAGTPTRSGNMVAVHFIDDDVVKLVPPTHLRGPLDVASRRRRDAIDAAREASIGKLELMRERGTVAINAVQALARTGILATTDVINGRVILTAQEALRVADRLSG
jgi:hypothetical protein